MSFYRKLPIRHKLRLVIMACVNTALLLACTAGLTYDHINFRHSVCDNLAILAEIFGSSSTAALSFQDNRAAEELLSGLKANQSIVRAFLYLPDGTPLAS